MIPGRPALGTVAEPFVVRPLESRPTASSEPEPADAGERPAGSDGWAARGGLWAMVRLARPHQWVKGGFIVVGPLYGGQLGQWLPVLLTLVAFSLSSSACYVVNDINDREADRAHPRKRRRPIASGAVSVPAAWALACGLLAASAVAVVALCLLGPSLPESARVLAGLPAGVLVGGVLAAYVANTMLYSVRVKHVVIADVMSLALGFVLRVLAGCAAVMVEPSGWLLNVTLFLAMFLAFGKRLGERRVLGERAAAARGVQAGYTDDLLRMAVVVTAVACLITYAGYVQAQALRYTLGFNLLWLTMLPATYGLLRSIVLMESGRFDDPTELATSDRPFQLAGALFVLTTASLMTWMPGGASVAVGAAAGP